MAKTSSLRSDDPRILVEIPARGGSKGVPRKALQPLGGMPLIAYTIRDALRIWGHRTRIVVNTDDAEIRETALTYGAEAPFLRPPEFATDQARLEDAHRFALDWYRRNEGFFPDVEIVMSPTHPFRRKNLINEALAVGLRTPSIFNLGSLAPARVRPDNLWVESNGRIQPFDFPLNGPGGSTPCYQSAFSFNIVFSYRKSVEKKRIPVILNALESIDIDEPKDLQLARAVVAKGLYPLEA